MNYYQILREKEELEKIADNLSKRGKTKEQIKLAISRYLDESKRKFNPDNEDLF